jgi:hypothetical protein
MRSFWQEVKLEWWMLKHRKPSSDVASTPVMLCSGRTLEVFDFHSSGISFYPLLILEISFLHPTINFFPSQLRKWKCTMFHRNSRLSRTFPTIPLSSTVVLQICVLDITCRTTVVSFEFLSNGFFHTSEILQEKFMAQVHVVFLVIFFFFKEQF